MIITVFTPTYNRAKLLPRLFESLCAQTCTDLEWLIVDDGSTDNTEEVVGNFIKDHKQSFPIQYIRKENGGKHSAINLGAKEAKGELFLIADSDDKLPGNAIADIAKVYETIKGDSSYAGVCGLDEDFNGKIIGNGLPQDIIDASSLDIRYRFGVTGDLKEVFRTKVMREFTFPETKGERFCPEALVWNRIAGKYKLRFFNKAVYSVEYQQGGLTANIVRIRMNSPMASMMTYAEMTEYPSVPLMQKMRAATNYWRFRFCATDKKAPMPQLAAKWFWTKPIGWLMHKKDKHCVKNIY